MVDYLIPLDILKVARVEEDEMGYRVGKMGVILRGGTRRSRRSLQNWKGKEAAVIECFIRSVGMVD